MRHSRLLCDSSDQPLPLRPAPPRGRSGGAHAARARGAWLAGHSPLPRRLRASPVLLLSPLHRQKYANFDRFLQLYPKAVCCATKGVHIAMASSLCHAPTWNFAAIPSFSIRLALSSLTSPPGFPCSDRSLFSVPCPDLAKQCTLTLVVADAAAAR